MKVAVDATAIPAQRLGVGVYVTELLRHVPRTIEVHAFVNENAEQELSSILPDARLHPVRIPNRPARIAWMHGVLPLRVRRLRPDVFWGPHYEIPPGLRCASVVTFHDPTFFTLPQIHERAKVEYFTRMSRAGVRRATRVIAVSDYARRGAIEHAGAGASVVDVIYEGIDPERFRPTSESSPFGDPYVFFVGALAPHKNVEGLVAAFDSVDVPHRLVIAGAKAWGATAVESAIAAANKRDRIELLGYVTDDDKIRRFQHADAFAFPSIAEGFGVPVLEAMACGAPVVTTTGSAPEEFASGVAELVPPGDVTALADALARVLTDGSRAAEMRQAGPLRARGFTWASAAEQTVETWRAAADAA
jgi:glycosyltransferase involved in cell wall biosynthesis